MAGELINIELVKKNLHYFISKFESLDYLDQPSLWYCSEIDKAIKNYRELGVAYYLSDMNEEYFYKFLSYSADLRVRLLKYADGAEKDFFRFSFLSNNGPFFDAIVCDNYKKAKCIVELSKFQFNDDYEYADDYTYTYFIFNLILNDFQLCFPFQDILCQLADDMEGEPLCRYNLCEAIAQQNEEKFMSAMSDLVDEHTLKYEREADNIIDHYRFRTQQYIFIEGLALKKIGRKLGFELVDEFKFIPNELV